MAIALWIMVQSEEGVSVFALSGITVSLPKTLITQVDTGTGKETLKDRIDFASFSEKFRYLDSILCIK